MDQFSNSFWGGEPSTNYHHNYLGNREESTDSDSDSSSDSDSDSGFHHNSQNIPDNERPGLSLSEPVKLLNPLETSSSSSTHYQPSQWPLRNTVGIKDPFGSPLCSPTDIYPTHSKGHLRNRSLGASRNDGNQTKRFSRLIMHHTTSSKGEIPFEEQNIEENMNEAFEAVGQEPGVNVATMSVELTGSIGSQVTIIDYCPETYRIAHYDVEKDGDGVITGSNQKDMVQKNLSDALDRRPEWSKVRWVVVNALSWEAIKPISLHYNLHPLAVEDMMDIPQRTKMEVFEEQLFCCYPLHVLSTTQTPYSFSHFCIRQIILGVFWIFKQIAAGFTGLKVLIVRLYRYLVSKKAIKKRDIENSPQFGSISTFCEDSLSKLSGSSGSLTGSETSSKKRHFQYGASSESLSQKSYSIDVEECIPFYTLKHGILCGDAYSSPLAEKIRQLPLRSIYDWNQANYLLKREALQNMHIPGTSQSYEITLEQVSLFMVGDSVITFFEKSAPEIYGPLENRLRSKDTMLRQSSDPAILVQALLDTSVDLLGPILNAYRTRLNRLQSLSVQQPNLQHTRSLHAFMTDLAILRPPVNSIASIVGSVWSKCSVSRKRTRQRKKRERLQKQQQHSRLYSHDESSTATLSDPFVPESKKKKESKLSDVTALYFSDVAHHALSYLQDLDDMRNQSLTLSSLIFNTISIHGSDYMKMLSLVSVVFLPLTFLTGYFGMNFKTFTILDHDVAYYWVVAAPAAAALSAVVMYSSTKYQVLEIWERAKAQI